MKKLFVLIVILSLVVCNVNSQEYSSKKHINKINKMYSKKLHLTKIQSEKFKKVLLVYNKKLEEVRSGENNKKIFNKLLKLQTIEIFNLVSSEQYALYKKILFELEPYKKYKF